MPFSEFASLCMSSHFVLTSTPLGGCYFSCFIDKELEVESSYTVKLGIKPNKPVILLPGREKIPIKQDKPGTCYEAHN